MERDRAIFDNVGQAVHVSFLVMAQEATQDAPLRKALIRVMESIKLETGNQRHWLDQLRGEKSGTVNFDGLAPGDIRAQCAMITQAVKTNLPAIERWVLQAKYGETDFEDVVHLGEGEDDPRRSALMAAADRVEAARVQLEKARDAFAAGQSPSSAWVITSTELDQRARHRSARDELASANHEMAEAESAEQLAQIAIDQSKSSALVDSGPGIKTGHTRRRWAFSAERIEAIKGLSDWFVPMFPRIKPLALDCMLGMLFANHKKLDISSRDLAAQFGGDHKKYWRASYKMKNHLRILEEKALARLEPIFFEHGVTCRN